jgi:hypothetical protein
LTINLSAFEVEESTPESRQRTRDAREAAREVIDGLTQEQKLALAGAFIKKSFVTEEVTSEGAPKTPDELWQYIYDTWGIKIARVAVCHDHDSPFDFICLGFFELVPNLFAIGPRGGGKSYDTACLMELNSRWKPGCESMVFGAVDEQNRKVFQDMVEQFIDGGLPEGETEIVGEALASLVQYANGSKVKSAPGTKAKMNGQHPPKAHAEEVEIFNDQAWPESRNMAAAKIRKDGSVIKAQNFGTSTRKHKNGRVDKIYQTFLKAKAAALKKFGRADVDDEVREHITLTSPWYCVIYCFAPETRVRTLRGLVSISEIETGDLVLSRGGQYRPVKQVLRRWHEGEIRSFKTSCGQPIRVTPEHPIAAVKDLRDNRVATKPTSKRSDLDFDEEWAQAGALEVGSYVRVETPLEHQHMRCVDPPSWKGRRGHSHDSYALTPDFLWSIGLYIAEGHASKGAIHFSLDQDEVEYEQRIRDTFEPLGFTVSRYDSVGSATSRSTSITVHSMQLAEWWDEWIGHGCQNKAIPSEIFSLGNHELKYVVQGVLDGDGSERWNALCQTSPVLATQMIELNLRRGGRATLTLPKKRPNRRQISYINNVDPAVQIAPGRADVMTHQRPRGYWDLHGHRYAKVVQNDYEDYSGWVYDLTIEGDEPSFVVENMLVHNCIFEVAAQVPNCRSAPDNQGRPEHELCKCNIVQMGTWDKEGREPRTLQTVCRGRLFRSRGHRSYDEIVQLFMQNDRGTWEAQQECIEAETSGVYVKQFSRKRHGLSFFPIDPANGPFYTGTDWGTTHFACTLWCQYLERRVEAVDYEGNKRVLPAGSRVILAEFYEDGLTSAEMGERVIIKEVKLASHTSFARLPIRKRWADVQGAGDKKVWRKLGLPTSSYGSRVFSEHVKEVRGKYEADRCFVVVSECANYCNEIEAWREDEKGNEVDENFNHAMAAGRYLLYGMLGEYDDPGALGPDQLSEAEKITNPEKAVPSVVMSAITEDVDLYAEEEDAWRSFV